MKISILVSVVILLMFIGCETPTLQEQKDECKKAGKSYTIEEKINLRTGEKEQFIKCT